MKKIIVLSFLLPIVILFGCKSIPDGQTVLEENTEQAFVDGQLRSQEGLIGQLTGRVEEKEKMIEDLKNMTEVDEKKIKDATVERDFLQGQLDMLMSENEMLKNDLANEFEKAEAAIREVKELLQKEIDAGDIEIVNYNGIIIIHIKNKILFDPDKANIRKENETILMSIAGIFDLFPDRVIRVEGHTASGRDISYPSSWELGSARSVNVVRFFQEKADIDPHRLVAVSFGEYRPIAPNGTEEGKATNRRIEIVLLNRPLYQWQDLLSNN